MKITMVGHSTVLIEMGGQRVLTDPYFGLRGNPAFSRVAPPANSREESREVEGVLISHSHWDHVDGPYLRSLRIPPKRHEDECGSDEDCGNKVSQRRQHK